MSDKKNVSKSHSIPLQRYAACLACRSRKVKCDAVRPVCGACRRYAISRSEDPDQAVCVYSRRTPRSNSEGEQHHHGVHSTASSVSGASQSTSIHGSSTSSPNNFNGLHIETHEERIRRLEDQVEFLQNYIQTKAEMLDSLQLLTQSPIPRQQQNAPIASTSSAQTGRRATTPRSQSSTPPESNSPLGSGPYTSDDTLSPELLNFDPLQTLTDAEREELEAIILPASLAAAPRRQQQDQPMEEDQENNQFQMASSISSFDDDPFETLFAYNPFSPSAWVSAT